MYSSNVFLLYSSDVFVKCILCILHCILSQACRGVSEAEEMLVTQMSNVARNEIASPPPHWQSILNVHQIFLKCQLDVYQTFPLLFIRYNQIIPKS